MIKGKEKHYHALIAGTNLYPNCRYSNGHFQWPDLYNAINDAEEVANILRNKFGYTTHLLRNPTKERLQDEIDSLGDILQPEDEIIVYISGHGGYDKKRTNGGYIVLSNSQSKEADKHLSSYMYHTELAGLLSAFKARHIFVTLDVCYAATYLKAMAPPQTKSENSKITAPAKDVNKLQKELELKTIRIALGASDTVVSDGWHGSFHSPFAERFISALEDFDGKNPYVSATKIYEKTYNTEGYSHPEIGDFTGKPGSMENFLLIPKNQFLTAE